MRGRVGFFYLSFGRWRERSVGKDGGGGRSRKEEGGEKNSKVMMARKTRGLCKKKEGRRIVK
jgi:hypothetical protein